MVRLLHIRNAWCGSKELIILKPELVIFDLDGTLIDSSDDIAVAANKMLLELGLAEMTHDEIKARIGWGVRFLLERLLPAPKESLDAASEREYEDGIAKARDIFIGYYGDNLTTKTRPYHGAVETLDYLMALNKKMAIVTNKPIDFTTRILEDLGLSRYFTPVLGGDSLVNRKPHPEPLLEAMKRLDVAPSMTVMVGDSSIDCLAARDAGVEVIGAAYGFRGREGLSDQGCIEIVDCISELQHLIN
jgi:phosphoglycolate phosphatase